MSRCVYLDPGGAPLQAAGAIHGDFERGFICAEVMGFDVLKELGSENAVKVRLWGVSGGPRNCTVSACNQGSWVQIKRQFAPGVMMRFVTLSVDR